MIRCPIECNKTKNIDKVVSAQNDYIVIFQCFSVIVITLQIDFVFIVPINSNDVIRNHSLNKSVGGWSNLSQSPSGIIEFDHAPINIITS